MKRKTPALIFVFAAAVSACSVLFDMGRYDEGGVRPNDVGAEDGNSSGRPGDGGNVLGDSGANGGLDGSADASSSGDAGPPKCVDEVEPNDLPSQANVWVIGLNCGTFDRASDIDRFEFQLTVPTKITAMSIPDMATLHITDNATTELNWTGGGSSTTLQPGTYDVDVSGSANTVGQTYEITLGN